MIFIQREGTFGSHEFTQDEARVLDKDGDVVIDWTSGGRIDGIPQGDGYTLETRSGDVVTRESLAVGIVVFAIGQSNMDGWFRDTDFVSPFDDAVYDLSGNPYRSLGAGATWFAKTLSDSLGGVPIGFVNAAVGGASLLIENYRASGVWLSEEPGNVYEKAIAALLAAGGKAEFTLWIQGESDANSGTTTYEDYYNGFQALLDKIAADVAGTTVLVGGLATLETATEENLQVIRDAQKDVAAARDNVIYVMTDLAADRVDSSHISNIESAWQALAIADAALASLSATIPGLQHTGTSGNDYYGGGEGDDTYSGLEGDDEIHGAAGADLLLGRQGNDLIFGDEGNDAIAGGAGDDTLSGGGGNDLIIGDSGADVISGGTGDDVLKGGADDDRLFGDDGNDTLKGDAGADMLAGGAGDDVYIATDDLDTIVEVAGEGHDTIIATASVVMADNVEDLTFDGTSTRKILTGTGNDLDNVITGSHTNYFTLRGGGGNDIITGAYSQDILYGDDGNDIISGGAAADDMYGGAGDDVFHVENTGDKIYEFAGEGTDWVYSSVSYALADNVENLSFAGTFARSGTGNDLDNIMIAGRTTSTLLGLGGNDTIYGDAWSDTIDGGTGRDIMIGGGGADTYIVDNIGDQTIEQLSAGQDTVKSSITWTLSANVENLTLSSNAAIGATGNELANVITGNDGDNTLQGLGGNDTLNGGAGIDRAIFTGNFASYTINRSAGTTKSASEGTDKLSNIEILQFANGTYIWDTGVFKTSNAAPALSFSQQSNEIVEAGSATAGVATASIAVQKSDPDGDATRYDLLDWTSSGNIYQKVGVFGTVTFDALTGIASYTLDNDRAATQALAQGQSANDNFTLTVRDIEGASITQSFSFSVTGSSDVAAPLNLKGTAGSDTMQGDTGDDWLDGRAGSDLFYGSKGDDNYVFDNSGDKVVGDDAGTDNIWSSVTVDLRQQSDFENLRLTGTDGISATGNDLNNTITGNAASNVIAGGRGVDTLYGKGGDDTFKFSDMGASNKDSIWDFDGNDLIELDASVFTGLATALTGGLDPSHYAVNKATTTDATIIYNSNTGVLSYDADGKGAGASQDIAFIGKKLAFFDYQDVFIV